NERLLAGVRVHLDDVLRSAESVSLVGDVEKTIHEGQRTRAIDEPAGRHQALLAGVWINADNRSCAEGIEIADVKLLIWGLNEVAWHREHSPGGYGCLSPRGGIDTNDAGRIRGLTR